jgi:hypothetical protein
MNTTEVIEKLKVAVESCRTSMKACGDILEGMNPPSGTTTRTYVFSAISFLQRTYGFLDNVGANLSMNLRNEQIEDEEMEKKRQEEQRLIENSNPILLGRMEKIHEPKMPKRVRKHSEKKVKHASKI